MADDRAYMIPEVTLDWRPWFAWHPVRTLSGRIVWLRNIERRRVWFIFWTTEYRDPGLARLDQQEKW